MTDLTQAETHYEFGANWKEYLRHIDAGAIASAEEGVLRLVPPDALRGSRFLDIGCGSGLHSLAALRLGVSELVAIDIDRDSVEATRSTLEQFTPCARITVREESVFDTSSETLGEFDVVYSWGVLHHTGSMWHAVEKAAALVKPGGLFVIALYQKTPLCGAWRVEKRLFTNAPKPVRAVLRGGVLTGLLIAITLRKGNPAKYIRDYKSSRGMNFFTDLDDWLGGYPYESATPAEIVAKFRELKFEPVVELPLPKRMGVFGTGCAEFTFRKL